MRIKHGVFLLSLPLLFLSNTVIAKPLRVNRPRITLRINPKINRAYINNRVLDRVRETGEARVIVALGDRNLPQARAADFRKREPAIRLLAQKVEAAAPKFRVTQRYKTQPFLAGSADREALQQLQASPQVEAIYPDRELKAVLNQSGPLIGQPYAEAHGFTGGDPDGSGPLKPVAIAIVDTGIDYTHPALGAAKAFTDMGPGYWAWRYVQAAVANNIVSGYPNGAIPETYSYRPTTPVTRDQMAVFIARAKAGGDAKVPDGPPAATFSDVPSPPDGHWAYKYIEYCASPTIDVVHGYEDGTYRPSGEVNRGQMAVFIARAIAGGDIFFTTYTPSTQTFTDVSSTNEWAWAYKYVEYIVERGVTQGYPDGLYHPEYPCNRDQMAVFVSRAFSLNWSGVIGGANLLEISGSLASQNPMDDNGHGTYTGGIAASKDTTYRGIAPGANLIAVKVLDYQGSGLSSTMIAALEWCMVNKDQYNIKVINMSLGDGSEWTDPAECDSYPEGQTIADVVAAGIIVTVASGNEGFTNGISMPACASAATSIGATYDGSYPFTFNYSICQDVTPTGDEIACFSDRGELLDMFAPGAEITSTAMGGGYETSGGTSAAAPHAAGAAAVLISMGITNPVEIEAKLKRTGIPIFDPDTGIQTPRVDLVRAITPTSSGPDLVVTAVSAPSSGTVGDPIQVTVTVKNQGANASGSCTAIAVLSANSIISPQDHVLATVSVPALNANQSDSQTISTTIPGVLGATYKVGAFVDSLYVVTEIDESNNSLRSGQMTVQVPSSVVLSTTIPATMNAGTTYPISVTLMNDGAIPWTTTGGVQLGAVSPQGTDRWGTVWVPLPGGTTVDTGASVTFSFNVTAPMAAGSYPCHWQLARGSAYFGEVATGAVNTRARDDASFGQDYPAVSPPVIVYMDYNNYLASIGNGGIPSITSQNLNTGNRFTMPDDIPFPINPNTGGPYPPYEYFDRSNHLLPDISGTWVTWMVDDMPSYPSDLTNSIWYYQITAYNLANQGMMPLRITLQNADSAYPSIDGNYLAWEDYRNDPDGLLNPTFFLADRSQIWVHDLNDTEHISYALSPATGALGPQLAPRISGNLVVWEDWRDGLQSDIYMYDLSVDTGGTGTPNWKRPPSTRPNPDPALTQLTNTYWSEQYPDISGRIVVYLDLRRDTGSGKKVDIYSINVDTLAQEAVVTDPIATRLGVRIDGTQIVWVDLRSGQGDIYYSDITTDLIVPVAASSVLEHAPSISGQYLAYAKFRHATTIIFNNIPLNWDVYNVWIQDFHLLPDLLAQVQ